MVQLNQWTWMVAFSAIFSACSEYEVKARVDPTQMGDSAEPIVTGEAPEIRVNPTNISMGVI